LDDVTPAHLHPFARYCHSFVIVCSRACPQCSEIFCPKLSNGTISSTTTGECLHLKPLVLEIVIFIMISLRFQVLVDRYHNGHLFALTILEEK
jgi:hypothetical protein